MTRYSIHTFCLTLIFSITLGNLSAQNSYPVKGSISNTKTSEPVSNANINISGTQTGSSSNEEGLFELLLPAGDHTLTISSLGYSVKTIRISVPEETGETLTIELSPEDMEIEGVDFYGNIILSGRDTSITREPVSLLPSITRIGAFEIERQGAVTITDAVKYVPGGWTETRGRKTKQFFSVRGQRYPYPDYSINGIWQKEFEETVYFFSALDIESIEIVRSSNALVKGLTGLSGVVDIKTRRPESETISVLGKYGGYNSYTTNLRYGNKVDNVAFNTSVSLFGTDGPAGKNSKERISNFHGELDWSINNNLELTAGSSYIQGLRQFMIIEDEESSSPNLRGRVEKFDPLRTSLNYVKLYRTGADGSLTEIQANLAYRNAYFHREPDDNHEEKDWEYGFNLLHSMPLSQTNTLRAGVLYNHSRAPEGKRYYVGRPTNIHTWSGVVASEQRAGRFVFDGGFRLISGYIKEFGGFGIEGAIPGGLREVAPIEDEFAPLEWQAVLGASYLLTNQTSLHYNFAGGTIAPRRGSTNSQGSEPENETRLQHEVGFRYNCINNNEFSLTTFFTQRKDALELTGQSAETAGGYLVELYQNLDKRNIGVEVASRVNLPSINSLIFANATFMKGQNEIDGKMTEDEKIPNIIVNSGFMFDHSGFDANLYLNYTGAYTNNRFVSGPWIAQYGDFPLGDFLSFDITAGYTFDRNFSTRLFIEARNIFDQKYYTVAGYPDIGRVISTGVRMDF